MTTLLIVESPAKAKTIGEYIGKDYTVRASIGHIRDLPKSNKNAIDIGGGFVPHYVISSGKKKIVDEIRTLAHTATKIILATDPDREGEAIAWHLYAILDAPEQKKVKRVTYTEITKEAIEEALQHPRDIDTHLRKAQEARRVLDRLVGYDLSGLIWKKVRYGLSAGRVQSPALRIIMEREREIRAFVPETFFTITACTKTPANHPLKLVANEEPHTKDRAEIILANAQKGTWSIVSVTETEVKRAPRPPFTTSTLQQTASTRLGFSPSRTMRAAQKLYEEGHITYMRTDSPTLSQTALAQLLSVVKNEFGNEHAESRNFKSKSKNAQEAHEAIRPTHADAKEAGRTGDEQALYQLIRARTLASQMKHAVTLRTKITARVDETDMPDFIANGSRITYRGWLIADPHAQGKDTEIPLVTTNDILTLSDITAEKKETQPPNRYSEAGLIKELEKRGIGRPSTYASIMHTIQERGYVEKVGHALIPTDVGDIVSTFLEKNFAEYISDSFTAQMENELDDIAEGKAEYVDTLASFYTPFHNAVESKADIPKLTTLGDAPKEFPCPTCRAPMQYKLGKNGTFMSCSRYPDCEGARTKDGGELGTETRKPVGTHPQTGEEIFVLDGRFGPYVQLGKKDPDDPKHKPRRASIPKNKKKEDITLADALHLLALPRTLGTNPENGKEVIANIGRFGPYVGCDGEFRSIKAPDDAYTIDRNRAIAILKEPKQLPRGVTLVRDLGRDQKTKKEMLILKSKSGMFVRRGLKRIYLPDTFNPDTATIEEVKALIAAS